MNKVRQKIFQERENKPNWRPRLPTYLKQKVPTGNKFFNIQKELADTSFPTVCEQAQCPNRTDCWSRGTLSFQILGAICTRRCHFCAETTGRPNAVDLSEPEKLAKAVLKFNLKHVVITSPARDDLPDQGSRQFARCIHVLREKAPQVQVEVLAPDFQGKPDLLKIVFQAKPDIFNHNIETVRRLTPFVRGRATYERSLEVLGAASHFGLTVKSGMMVGLGETRDELLETLRDLKSHGVQYITIGQYLPPSEQHYPVHRFYRLTEFESLKAEAEPLFQKVMVGPLVRSSYHADEMSLD